MSLSTQLGSLIKHLLGRYGAMFWKQKVGEDEVPSPEKFKVVYCSCNIEHIHQFVRKNNNNTNSQAFLEENVHRFLSPGVLKCLT